VLHKQSASSKSTSGTRGRCKRSEISQCVCILYMYVLALSLRHTCDNHHITGSVIACGRHYKWALRPYLLM
jgi:hypothetical protein